MSSRKPKHRHLAHPDSGFTLIELLVVVVIIGILAAATMAGLIKTRETARHKKTEATIAKLNDVIMRRYERYIIRRVPISTHGMDRAAANRARLNGIRDLMRMEMPERLKDITAAPVAVPSRPALAVLYGSLYQASPPSDEYGPAECLFLIVNTGSADDRSLFKNSEIGDVDGDGWQEFIDGWGRPIYFLRWAPGFAESEIQIADPVNNHDPFDTHNVDPGAYHLYPLIYSAGAAKEPSLELSKDYTYSGDPYGSGAGAPAGGSTHIHNHLSNSAD
jgi:prepilin-type N-terminal cleavage/methylation domain-containing protein